MPKIQTPCYYLLKFSNCSVPEQLHALRCTQIAIKMQFGAVKLGFLLKQAKMPRGILPSE